MAPVLIDLESGGPHTLDSQPGTGSGVGSGGLRAVALDSVLEAVALDNSKPADVSANQPEEPRFGEPEFFEYHSAKYIHQVLRWCLGYKTHVGYACFVTLSITIGLSVKCAVVAAESPECNVLESGWWKEAAECPFGHALVTAMHSAIVCMSLVFIYCLLSLYGRFNEHIHEGSKGHLVWARRQLDGDSCDGDTPAQSAGAMGGLWNPGAVPNVSEFSPLMK